VNAVDPLGLESFWDGPGGRIIKGGVSTGLKCGIPGAAYGSALGPGGAAAFGAGGFMACGAAGMLTSTLEEIFWGGEDDLPETLDHRQEAPPPKKVE
jgi:hypothetical protein